MSLYLGHPFLSSEFIIKKSVFLPITLVITSSHIHESCVSRYNFCRKIRFSVITEFGMLLFRHLMNAFLRCWTWLWLHLYRLLHQRTKKLQKFVTIFLYGSQRNGVQGTKTLKIFNANLTIWQKLELQWWRKRWIKRTRTWSRWYLVEAVFCDV